MGMLPWRDNDERILGPTTVPSEGNVAFYAYMSTSLVNPSSFHTLIFDTVITNDGNGYHPNTGVFIVPESGLYVFTWVMRQWTHATHGTELMVNKISSGSVFLHSMTDDHSVTGLVVIHANQGDDVFVRTQVDNNYGNIGSDYHGKTSFAGWKIN
ncbi:C1q-related factor-like [Saccostrea cucullata]|uniref:C1q-related factor-like n=1 Tax=Saccostrea cuccullata TaxID=36930 RepID=UPI002ED6BB79